MPVLMPKDTREILGTGAQKCESRSLLQQKLVFFDDTDEIPEYKQISLGFILTNGRECLEKLIQEKRGAKERAERKGNTNSKIYRQACAFLDKTKDILSNRSKILLFRPQVHWIEKIPNKRKRTFELKTVDRLIIGQSDGVLENCGLKIHRFFGIPYLPGSALKGIARDVAKKLTEVSKISKEEFYKIFGNEPEEKENVFQGAIGFLSAFPTDPNARIEYDICTPHYKAYYGHEKDRTTGKEKNPLALDTESPVPNIFPVIGKGVKFMFTILCLDKRFSDEQAEALLNLAEEILKKALIENGIGAKTAAGYGRFEEVSTATQSETPKQSETSVVDRISEEDPLIEKWRGKVSTGNFKLILEDLSKINNLERLKAIFYAIMPKEELKQNKLKKNNPFWQSFSSREQGKKILEQLNIKLG